MFDLRFWIPRIIVAVITLWLIGRGIAIVTYLQTAIATAVIL